MLRSAYAQFVFVVGGADHDQMEKMRQFMSQLVAGWDVATVREIVAETLHNIVDPLVYDEAVQLIEEHHLAGRDVVIVSSSGSEVVEPIGAMLGADRVVATRLEIVDGRYTGEIDYYAYAEEKANAIRALADERGYDLAACYGYSDSATDMPMLEAVGHPHVVNPDKELRKVAASRAGRCWSSPSPSRCAAGCRCPRRSRPSPRSRWAAWSRWGPSSGPAHDAAARGQPPDHRRACFARGEKSSLEGGRRAAYKGQQNSRATHGPVPTRRSTLPNRALVTGTTPGAAY